MGKLQAQRHAAQAGRTLDADLAAVRADKQAERAATRAANKAAETARKHFTKDDLEDATHVLMFGVWHQVVRLNTKTVTVYHHSIGTERYPYKEVRKYAVASRSNHA